MLLTPLSQFSSSYIYCFNFYFYNKLFCLSNLSTISWEVPEMVDLSRSQRPGLYRNPVQLTNSDTILTTNRQTVGTHFFLFYCISNNQSCPEIFPGEFKYETMSNNNLKSKKFRSWNKDEITRNHERRREAKGLTKWIPFCPRAQGFQD